LRLLLDTHAMIWAVLSPRELSPRAREAIADPANDVFVSAVGAWELAIKSSTGRLLLHADAPERVRGACERAGFAFFPVTVDHAYAVRDLPWHHRDPFDRLLVAQARIERCRLVSKDQLLRPYPVDLLW
jgi:PIN domain nuclease of toxin-antitoxin system